MKKILAAAIGASAGLAGLIVLTGCEDAPPADRAAQHAADASAGSESRAALGYDELVALIAEPDPFTKASKLGALLPELGPDSVPVVKDVLEQANDLEVSAVDFELLINYWARHEPEPAAMYALMRAPRAYRVGAIYGAVVPWVKADPEEAVKGLRVWTHESGDGGAAVQVALVRGWFESGKPGLEQYIRDLGASIERQRALSAYANVLARHRGADAVVEWAEAIPDDDARFKLEAFRSAGSELVPFDLEVAKRFCDAYCEGEHGSNVRVRIADRWAVRDAPAAIEWLASAPESSDKRLAIRSAYATWGTADREAATRWIAERIANGGGEAPEWLSPTLPLYARYIAKDAPADGLAIALRLKDEREREVVTVELARQWRAQDEPAAEAWLQKSSLSAETLESVRAVDPPAIRARKLQQEQQLQQQKQQEQQ